MKEECLGRDGFYSHCKLIEEDEYWGKWILCECGYSNNTYGAKYCGGCGKLIQIISKDNDNWLDYFKSE